MNFATAMVASVMMASPTVATAEPIEINLFDKKSVEIHLEQTMSEMGVKLHSDIQANLDNSFAVLIKQITPKESDTGKKSAQELCD